jgi:predicted transcriptional regulator of viral defense system
VKPLRVWVKALPLFGYKIYALYLCGDKLHHMRDIKHKKITVLSGRLLSDLNAKSISWFTSDEAYKILSGMSVDAVRQQLSRMVEEGLLMRIKEGIYYIIPYEQDSDLFMPDWHLLAKPLAGSDYYIGYYSALQIHNLITQPSLKEQIVVGRQIKPALMKLKGVTFQFIYHNPKHFFGYKKMWIDSFNKVLCSDLEKTIIDCLYKPDYAGGIIEIAKTIYLSKDKLNYKQLLDYIVRFDSQAVVKRLGYLLELLNIPAPIIDDLQNMRTDSITVLDTEVPKQGKITSRWRIQQNVAIETIKSAIIT